MSTIAHMRCGPCRFTIFICLVKIVQALTIPVDDCIAAQSLTNNTFDHEKATTCAPSFPTSNLPTNATSSNQSSSLSFPPEPFLFRIVDTPYIIKYTNYGGPISSVDAVEIVSTAQEEILYEMDQFPDHVDVVIATTRIWAEDSARLSITPTPSMRHSTLGLVFAGMIDCGELHGFIEADLEFLNIRDVFRPFGNGFLSLDG